MFVEPLQVGDKVQRDAAFYFLFSVLRLRNKFPKRLYANKTDDFKWSQKNTDKMTPDEYSCCFMYIFM